MRIIGAESHIAVNISASTDPLMHVSCAQCIAREVDGKREVAGVHWDYDCYGAPGKIAQVCLHLCVPDQALMFMSQPSASQLCAQLL